MNKSVGITGAAGNVGSTLAKGLADRYDLKLFDLKENAAKGIERLDCAVREDLTGKFDGLDTLIHLAGDPRPNAPTAMTLRNNFKGTSLAFDAANVAGVKKIVFASSNFYHEGEISEALSHGTRGAIKLGNPPTPHSLYGQSKVFGETIGRHYSYLGLQFIALRIGWTVPGDNPVPYDSSYMRGVYCSHRDLVAAFVRAIEIDTDFLTAFAVSNNRKSVFDLAETREKLGFVPQDDAENFFTAGGRT